MLTVTSGTINIVAKFVINAGYRISRAGKRVERTIPQVKLESGVAQSASRFLKEKGISRPLRIDLTFTGCCDASLGLRVDDISESDLYLEADGLTFIIDPEVYRLAGGVAIAYVDEEGRKGFILTSERPVSEWEGFGVSDIQV
jgi:Fe-S cluster assembly iron-binding protein IscA